MPIATSATSHFFQVRLAPIDLFWTKVFPGQNQEPDTDIEVDIRQARSITLQASTKHILSYAKTVIINTHINLDSIGGSWTTVPFSKFTIEDNTIVAWTVQPGGHRMRFRLDNPIGGLGYVALSVLVRY